MTFTFLDGPMGTELERRGVALPLPEWTADALAHAPDVVTAIHRAYASRLALARQASDHLPVIADLDVGDAA